MLNCVVSAETMKAIEESYLSKSGASINELMERAGKALSDQIKNILKRGNVLFVCGTGNNGGDGITAARYLPGSYTVKVFIFGAKNKLSKASNASLSKYKGFTSFDTSEEFKDALKKADLVVDCLFGFGFNGSIKKPLSLIFEQINKSQKYVLSVDIPSGVEATTGKVNGVAVRARETLSFTCAKLGHFLPPGSFLKGRLKVIDIGIDFTQSPEAYSVDKEVAKTLLPKRKPDLNKKSAGSVLVIGGSAQYTGASCMAAEAVLKAGAGYVAIACPDSIRETIQQKTTEPIVVPMPSVKGSLALSSFECIMKIAKEYDVALIGPGLSTNDESKQIVRRFVNSYKGKIVIDADALTALVNEKLSLNKNIVLTPHSGELARLVKIPAGSIDNNRLNISKDFAKKIGAIVLLKGSNSITTDGKTSYFNSSGNSGLATAGTGDILSGMIAGLAAQGSDIFSASATSAFIHGLASDIAVQELTEYSLIATDLLSWIPKAIKLVISK